MPLITYNYICEECALVFDELVEREDRDKPQECPECGAVSTRTVSAPNFHRKSLPDGNNRFEKLKKQRKLQRQAAEAKATGDHDTEKQIRREIKQRRDR